jgi:hypothetical protein
MIFNSRSTQRSWRRFGRWESYERRAPPKHRGSSRGGLVSRMRGIIIHGGWPAQRLQIKVKIRTKSLSSCRRKAVKTPTGGQERRVDLAATSHPAVVVPPFTASLALSLSLSLSCSFKAKREGGQEATPGVPLVGSCWFSRATAPSSNGSNSHRTNHRLFPSAFQHSCSGSPACPPPVGLTGRINQQSTRKSRQRPVPPFFDSSARGIENRRGSLPRKKAS